MYFICDIENIERHFNRVRTSLKMFEQSFLLQFHSFGSFYLWYRNIENIETRFIQEFILIESGRVWRCLKKVFIFNFIIVRLCVLFVISKISKHVLFENFNRVRTSLKMFEQSLHFQFHVGSCVLFETSKISNEKYILIEFERVWRCLNKILIFNFIIFNHTFYLWHWK